MRPFPDLKPDLLAPDPDLQQAFDTAIASSAQLPRKTPIVIVALNDSAPHGVAGRLDAEVHYTASLVKVAAMYAAFELRAAANELLLLAQPPAADVFPLLHSAFDFVIENNRVLQLTGVNLPGFLLPRWEQVFDVDPATAAVNFSPAFFGNLFDAITGGSSDVQANTAAGVVVHGLGFGYLTKAVAEAGFFNPDTASQPQTADGMWLCGDFGNGFPPQRIPCMNDTPVAQATSARQMARLFTFLASNSPLVDAASDGAMVNLLTQATARLHLFLNRDTSVQFVTLRSKIGLGPLNNGTRVASEAAIIQENSLGRRFVVVFQNQPFTGDSSIFPVSQVVDATITSFLFP
jgi:hypothetical protein